MVFFFEGDEGGFLKINKKRKKQRSLLKLKRKVCRGWPRTQAKRHRGGHRLADIACQRYLRVKGFRHKMARKMPQKQMRKTLSKSRQICLASALPNSCPYPTLRRKRWIIPLIRRGNVCCCGSLKSRMWHSFQLQSLRIKARISPRTCMQPCSNSSSLCRVLLFFFPFSILFFDGYLIILYWKLIFNLCWYYI